MGTSDDRPEWNRKRKPKKISQEARKAANQAAFRAARALMDDPLGSRRPLAERPITDEDCNVILSNLAEGRTVRSTCRELGIGQSSFHHRVMRSTELAAEYEKARKMFAHALFERSLDKTDSLDLVDEAQDGAPVLVAIAKHQLDTYKWATSKLHPSAYGDKVTTVHVGDKDNPVFTKSEHKDTTEMSAQELLDQLKARNRSGS